MAQRGKFTILVGGQYGSEGKGAVIAQLAKDFSVHIRVGSPNAGHTIYWNNEKHVMQSIPCGWINENAFIVIGRGALLNMEKLMEEFHHIKKYFPNFEKRFFIDEDAGILDEKFHKEEGGVDGEMHKRIGSTGEGVGPARIARLKRDKNEFKLLKDIINDYPEIKTCMIKNTPKFVADLNDNGENVIIEGTQGSGLSLLHSNFPYCTSIDTNAAGIASEFGVAPSRITDVIMVVRTYPIRVAGNSGPMKNEISFEELSKRLGTTIVPEKTTVTKKVRRIAAWDDELFANSMLLNNPTKIVLTFVDYLDKELYNVTDRETILKNEKFNDFIKSHNIPFINFVSTGPNSLVEV